jgi:hypothetical protein
MTETGLFYIRFMDDILVLAPTRWKLRRAIAVVNHILGALRLQKHPAKTFIGRIGREFDFLGYHFSRGAIGLGQQTLQYHASRLHRLYERQKTAPACAVCLDVYVARWLRWCRSRVGWTTVRGRGSAGAAAREIPSPAGQHLVPMRLRAPGRELSQWLLPLPSPFALL